MATDPASPGDAQERVPHNFTRLAPTAKHPVRSPHALPHQTVGELVEHWTNARLRTFMAKHDSGEIDPEDLFVELVYGGRIAQEAAAGRWCVVADLLRSGAVDSWSQISDAMDVTETEARDGFRSWLAGQADLHRRTGTIGLPEAEAAELYSLSAVVAW